MAGNAHLRVPEIGLGMNMSWQSVPRMLHLMGPARTKQAVILADERISAQEAQNGGWWRRWSSRARPSTPPWRSPKSRAAAADLGRHDQAHHQPAGSALDDLAAIWTSTSSRSQARPRITKRAWRPSGTAQADVQRTLTRIEWRFVPPWVDLRI